jgi:hypothetical protein
MRHRVTTETELKEAGLIEVALRAAGFEFTREGEAFAITAADGVSAPLDLQTGRLTCESVEMPKVFGVLRQHYAEARYRAECERLGIRIESRTVDREGRRDDRPPSVKMMLASRHR